MRGVFLRDRSRGRKREGVACSCTNDGTIERFDSLSRGAVGVCHLAGRPRRDRLRTLSDRQGDRLVRHSMGGKRLNHFSDGGHGDFKQRVLMVSDGHTNDVSEWRADRGTLK
jgi:hypothetical protein